MAIDDANDEWRDQLDNGAPAQEPTTTIDPRRRASRLTRRRTTGARTPLTLDGQP